MKVTTTFKRVPVITYWRKGTPVNERAKRPCYDTGAAHRALKLLRKRGYHARLSFVVQIVQNPQ